MNDRYHGPGEPPPFPGPGRKRYRAGRPGQRDWQQEYFGKRPEQSWAEYFGMGPDSFRSAPPFGKKGGSQQRSSGPASGEAYHGRSQGEDDMGLSTNSPNPHRLYRSRTDYKLAGVCGGIAEYTNVDAWMVRLGFIIGFFFFPPVFLFGYPILWWLLKERPAALYESREEEVFWRSVATKPDQTLSGLKGKFRELDRDIGKLETFIASREYDLHRQFRDLERK